jgi:hypothetical protein
MRTCEFLVAFLPFALPFQSGSQGGRGGADPSPDAIKMGSPMALPSGASRESMWPAPTAEDWKLPCLVAWQRTFDDAVKVAKATGKPILVCVNMDGEIASEHFAGIRYRRPETAKLYESYVCVIASVYRHTPRDYDEEGQRIPCPRFGTVTCGEHIAIEPLLYEKYFDGKRISPRHIMIDLSAPEHGEKPNYDVYYSWDTQTVFHALEVGVANRPPPLPTGDRPLLERVASTDSADRAAVEVAYREGTKEVRRSLLEATFKHKDVEEIDLLRQAIFGFDVELARIARRALAQCDSEAAVDVIAEALKLPMDPSEREALLAAVVRLGEKYPRARTLAAMHQGLALDSSAVDVKGWTRVLDAEPGTSARASYETAAHLESRARASEAKPDDGPAKLELAESFLARAEDVRSDPKFVRFFFEDARKAALDAEKLGARGWKLDATLAVAASALGDRDESLKRAEAAVTGGMPPPSQVQAAEQGAHSAANAVSDRDAVAVLALFAQARQRAIAKAYREKSAWPPQWLADIHAAYAVLAKHPLGTDLHCASHYDFLRWLGATPKASEVLEEGLARFPDSGLLHERLRGKLLWEKGPDGLEAEYATRLAKKGASPLLGWFAGYASIVAAESHRRAAAPEKARAAYERAIQRFEAVARERRDCAESADVQRALATAGRARIELEAGDYAAASGDVRSSFAIAPGAAATRDGLGISPVETAKMLLARAQAEHKDALKAEVEQALASLAPEMLELPPNERGIPVDVPADGGPRPDRRRP